MRRTFTNVITLLRQMEYNARSIAEFEQKQAREKGRELGTLYYQERERERAMREIADMLTDQEMLNALAKIYENTPAAGY